PVAHRDDGAVRDLVALALAIEVVDHDQRARARHCDQILLLVANRLDVLEAHGALVLDLDRAHRSGTRGGAADVERAHRELGTRLTDRLRGDDTHRLAEIDALAAREIATVALRAHAVARFAVDRRAHPHLVDAEFLELRHPALVEQGT